MKSWALDDFQTSNSFVMKCRDQFNIQTLGFISSWTEDFIFPHVFWIIWALLPVYSFDLIQIFRSSNLWPFSKTNKQTKKQLSRICVDKNRSGGASLSAHQSLAKLILRWWKMCVPKITPHVTSKHEGKGKICEVYGLWTTASHLRWRRKWCFKFCFLKSLKIFLFLLLFWNTFHSPSLHHIYISIQNHFCG